MEPNLIGINQYMDTRGRLFEKVAGTLKPVETKYTAAEERFVQRHLSEGGNKYENSSQ